VIKKRILAIKILFGQNMLNKNTSSCLFKSVINFMLMCKNDRRILTNLKLICNLY